MKHDQALLNRIWSRTLLEELSRWGIEHVCAAPGSRSTPLILEAAEHSALQLHTHFDERGLGFMALGLAKATQQPVVVIVTSGTAVANLLPAIVESKLTGESLIVLSSDRPIELVGCGANQAIEQAGIFSSHVTHSVNLPSPTTQIPLAWLLSRTDEVMHQQRQHGGSLHINCPYPEPLYSVQPESNYAPYCQPIKTWQAGSQLYSQRSMLSHIDAPAMTMQGKGVVIIGAVAFRQAQTAVAFAEQMGWPYLCDPQAGVASPWSHYDLWLQNPTAAEQLSRCEHIVQFGGRLVSKRLNQWITQQVQGHGAHYEVITQDAAQHNASHLPQQRWVMSPQVWTAPYLSSHENDYEQRKLTPHQGWADDLIYFADACAQLAALHLNQDHLSEVAVALTLSDMAEQHPLFLGNSLMIRMIDMLSTLTDVPVYSNRGASGIDGLIATAAGVQKGLHDGLLVIIGDTALLHDLNSLALLHDVSDPMIVVVTNNDGGAIFDLLPVQINQRDALYRMPHGFNFCHAAAQFGLSYANPHSLQEYQRVIEQHWREGTGALLLEVSTPPHEASQHVQQLVEQVHAL